MNFDGFSIPEHVRLVARSLLAGLFAVLFGAMPARSDDSAGQTRPDGDSRISIDNVEVGLGGLYKVGEWTGLWVTVRSSVDISVQVVVDAPDPDDNLASLPSRFVNVKSGAPTRVESCFRTGRLSGEFQFEVRDAEGRALAARRLRPTLHATSRATSIAVSPNGPTAVTNDLLSAIRPAMKLDTSMWVTLGKFDLAASFAKSEAAGKASAGTIPDAARDLNLARLDSLSYLPSDPRALQSVDVLIFPTGRDGTDGDSLLQNITAEQDAVVQSWVRRGGHLLLSVGSESAVFEKSPLASWVPIKVDGQMPLRQLSGFESFSNRNAPLKFSGTVPASRLASLPRANVVLSEASNPHPLIASVPCGLGRVTFVAIDIDKPPLSNWPALKTVLLKLARGGSSAARIVTRKSNRQLTHVGVTDLATQFQFSAEDFTGIRRPSYWWVMGLILLYVGIIGPLDYLLVHRVLRRPELTWLTFPILVGGSIAAAAWYAHRVNGRALEINQVDLVDIDSASGTVRNNTWISLYSPQHERFAVAVEPTTRNQFGKREETHGVHLEWVGVPENSVGGMYRSGGASFGGRNYRFGVAAAAVEDIPVAAWSTKTLLAEWRSEMTQPVVEGRLESLGTGQLRGTITHHFGAPLEDCMVVASGWAYIPTTPGAILQPDREWALRGDKGVRQRDLKALLTGEKQTRDKKEGSVTSEIVTTNEPYDPLGRNFGQQIRMISFHEAAGGSEYTGLAHAALRGLELTSLMQLGRAVLIGRIASSPARVRVDGAIVEPAGHSTWVRLVLPIEQSGALPEKVIPKASETVIPKARRDIEP